MTTILRPGFVYEPVSIESRIDVLYVYCYIFIYMLYIVYTHIQPTPHPVTVTTRIIALFSSRSLITYDLHFPLGGIGLPTLGFGWFAVGSDIWQPSKRWNCLSVCSESKKYYTPTGESDMQTCYSLKQNEILTTVTSSLTLLDCILKYVWNTILNQSFLPCFDKKLPSISESCILHIELWS